ncbi:MAG: multidrug effflux MFS transporter [Gulosibacter sp.]|uniref:multidrug effflux MFS transporter n=1 Tax=Gulosibacter sp. TaxID=2817531 RepID=UPI003F8EF2BD
MRDYTGKVPPFLFLSLGVLSMVAPFASDMYLSAFPEMASAFRTSPGLIQLTLVSFMVGGAVGPLIIGPLSDRYGRRTPLIIFAAIAFLASVAAVLTNDIVILILLRFIQGFAGIAGSVIGRAVVADLVSGAVAARAFGILMMVLGIAPVVAPLLGGPITEHFGWRATLGAVAIVQGLMLVFSFTVPETLPRSARSRGSGVEMLRSFVVLAKDIRFSSYVLAVGVSFSLLFVWISASSFMLQSQYGVSPTEFSLLFALNATGFLLAGTLNSVFVTKIGPERMLMSMSATVLVLVSALAILSVAGVHNLTVVLTLVFIASAATAPIMANGTALALGRVSSRHVGVASALIGSVENLLAAAIAPLLALWGSDSRGGMVALMVVTGIVTFVLAVIGRGKVRKTH